MAAGSANAPHLAPSRFARYSTVGTFTFAVPAGVYRLHVKGCGAGGSGGNNVDDPQRGGAGGGGGAYFEAVISVEPTQQYQIVIGEGGAAQAAAGSVGLNGEDTYFRRLGVAGEDLRAGGGKGGGIRAPGGAGGTAYVPGAGWTELVFIGDWHVVPGNGGFSAGYAAIDDDAARPKFVGAGGGSMLGRGAPEVGIGAAAAGGSFGGGGGGGPGAGVDSGPGGNGIVLIYY
jgi:hypothetical protein